MGFNSAFKGLMWLICSYSTIVPLLVIVL